MSISESDVRHVAALARLGLSATRTAALVDELNGILVHMDVLMGVALPESAHAATETSGMPLREDVSVPGVPAAARAEFAPSTREGFFLVPRLDTHGTASARVAPEAPDRAGNA